MMKLLRSIYGDALMIKDYINAILIACFITLSITSHIIALKVVKVFGVELIPSSITYMACFVIIDLIAIINKKRFIYLIISIEAIANVFMIATTTIVAHAPSPDYVLNSDSYKTVFTPVIILYVANTIGSLIAFIVDYNIFSRMYKRYGFLISSLFSSVFIIVIYTATTDILAFKMVYPDHYLELTGVNILTNILFLGVITFLVTPLTCKLRKIKL